MNHKALIIKSLFFVVLLTVLSSCNRKTHRVGGITPPATPTNKDSLKIIVPESEELIEIEPLESRFLIVFIEKEPSYGGGSLSYRFSLHNDGVAFYTCKSDCPKGKGQYYGYVGKEKAKEVLQYIEQYNLFHLNSVYPTNGRPVPYIPLTKYTISTGDIEKKINAYHHIPASLSLLEKSILDIILNTNWKLTYE